MSENCADGVARDADDTGRSSDLRSIGLSRADESPRELFLIDGNSLVYRAFFALPESISTSKGFPTSAIFGFASMLVKIISDYGVKPTLVVWDAGMSGRDEVYDEYKAGPPRAAGPALRAVAAPAPARRVVRLPEHQGAAATRRTT